MYVCSSQFSYGILWPLYFYVLGDSVLSGQLDFIQVDVHPSEQYKSVIQLHIYIYIHTCIYICFLLFEIRWYWLGRDLKLSWKCPPELCLFGHTRSFGYKYFLLFTKLQPFTGSPGKSVSRVHGHQGNREISEARELLWTTAHREPIWADRHVCVSLIQAKNSVVYFIQLWSHSCFHWRRMWKPSRWSTMKYLRNYWRRQGNTRSYRLVI